MKTVQDAIDGFTESLAEHVEHENFRLRILSELPAHLPAPTISNEKKAGRLHAWVSWRSMDYAPEGEPKPREILAALEAAGFKWLPASLAKYGSYRRSVHVGLCDELPEEYSRSKLQDCEAIAPLWLNASMGGGYDSCEALAFYMSPSGIVLRVSVKGPRVFGATARRVEYRGDWYYETGSARLRYPEAWHSVTTPSDETPITQIAAHSGAYRDTEKGVSACLYFTPFLEPQDFPLSPAQFLARLEG